MDWNRDNAANIALVIVIVVAVLSVLSAPPSAPISIFIYATNQPPRRMLGVRHGYTTILSEKLIGSSGDTGAALAEGQIS